MFLSMDVLRFLTIRALRGRTWAEHRVYDSPAQPADIRLEEERAPFIAVYTDDADHSMDGSRDGTPTMSLAAGTTTVFLVIECATGDMVTVTPDEPGADRDPSDPDPDQPPGPDTITTLAHTDEALELTIGLMARQCAQALLATDNPWAELWRELAIRRIKVEVRRGGPGQDDREDAPAIRFASRVMRLELEVLADPVFGEPLTHTWARIVTAMEEDDEMADIGRLVRSHVDAPVPLPGWVAEQKRLMLTRRAVRGIGIAPVVIPEETEAPMSHTITTTDTAGGQPKDIVEGDDGQ